MQQEEDSCLLTSVQAPNTFQWVVSMGSEIHFDLGIYIREKWLGADNLPSLDSHGKYKSTPFTL